MRTNTLQDTILSQQLFKTGYALLLQTDGTVIAGRVWNATHSNTSININDLPGEVHPEDFGDLSIPKVKRMNINGEDVFVSQVKR